MGPLERISEEDFQKVLTLICEPEYASPTRFREYVREKAKIRSPGKLAEEDLQKSLWGNHLNLPDLFPKRKDLGPRRMKRACRILYHCEPGNIPFEDADVGGPQIALALLKYACEEPVYR